MVSASRRITNRALTSKGIEGGPGDLQKPSVYSSMQSYPFSTYPCFPQDLSVGTSDCFWDVSIGIGIDELLAHTIVKDTSSSRPLLATNLTFYKKSELSSDDTDVCDGFPSNNDDSNIYNR